MVVNAAFDKQLMISVSNKVGTLAEVTHIISSSGINLVALCAYAIDNTVAIMFVTEDNNEAKRVLEERNFHVAEEEVILLTIENKAGALQTVTEKIAEAGIDLTLIYGSVEKEGNFTRIVLISRDNMEAMMVIKMMLERR